MANKRLLQMTVAITSVATILGAGYDANAITLTTFSPVGFSDARAGITEHEIEDFEDTQLLDGLSIEWDNPDFGPATTLPYIYKPSNDGFSNNTWDGVHTLNNNQQSNFYLSRKREPLTTFYFDGGVDSVGLGISNYEHGGALLFVNGEEFANFNDLKANGGASRKSIYIKLDAESNEKINSIAIKGQYYRGAGFYRGVDDFLTFDHLAIKGSAHAVPEPLTMLGAATALAFGAGFKRKLAKTKVRFTSKATKL